VASSATDYGEDFRKPTPNVLSAFRPILLLLHAD
jgi:hypothetical protein